MELTSIPVRVINLEKHGDRKEHMTKLLESMGFVVTDDTFRVPVKPDAAKVHPLMAGAESFPTKASHTLTYLQELERGAATGKPFFIMEDDIVPVLNRSARETAGLMRKAIKEAETEEFDMLYFEYCAEKCLWRSRVSKGLHRLSRPFCLACVLYTPKAARFILDNHRATDYSKPRYGIDKFISSYIWKGQLKALGRLVFKQDPRFGSFLQGSGRYNVQNSSESFVCDPVEPLVPAGCSFVCLGLYVYTKKRYWLWLMLALLVVAAYTRWLKHTSYI
jgi:GR25 family glycosyltransferase involved in LPS biosynthesis